MGRRGVRAVVAKWAGCMVVEVKAVGGAVRVEMVVIVVSEAGAVVQKGVATAAAATVGFAAGSEVRGE